MPQRWYVGSYVPIRALFDLVLGNGAGEGNRIRMASLEDCAQRLVRGLDLRKASVREPGY
jgi:hypothetical protein